jgi:hypothetical protein
MQRPPFLPFCCGLKCCLRFGGHSKRWWSMNLEGFGCAVPRISSFWAQRRTGARTCQRYAPRYRALLPTSFDVLSCGKPWQVVCRYVQGNSVLSRYQIDPVRPLCCPDVLLITTDSLCGQNEFWLNVMMLVLISVGFRTVAMLCLKWLSTRNALTRIEPPLAQPPTASFAVKRGPALKPMSTIIARSRLSI